MCVTACTARSYAPLSVRLVERAMEADGWRDAEAGMRLLPGETREVRQEASIATDEGARGARVGVDCLIICACVTTRWGRGIRRESGRWRACCRGCRRWPRRRAESRGCVLHRWGHVCGDRGAAAPQRDACVRVHAPCLLAHVRACLALPAGWWWCAARLWRRRRRSAYRLHDRDDRGDERHKATHVTRGHDGGWAGRTRNARQRR